MKPTLQSPLPTYASPCPSPLTSSDSDNGTDTTNSVALKTFSNLVAIDGPSSITFTATKSPDDLDFYLQFIGRVSPQILGSHLKCTEALRLSQDRSSPLLERFKLMPKIAGNDTASGTYYLQGNDGEKTLVVKPTCQEANKSYRFGIEPGQSAIRERLVWKGQQLFGYDFGIPPVSLCLMDHEKFVDRKNCVVTKCLTEIKNYGYDFTEEEFIAVASQHKKLETFIQELLDSKRTKFITNLLQKEVEQSDIDKLIKVVEINHLSTNLYDLINEEFAEKTWIKENRANVIGLVENVKKQMGVEKEITTLWNFYHQPSSSSKPALLSVQQYAPNVDSLDKLEPEDIEEIPEEEFYKFVIAIIFLGTDMHHGNVLLTMDNKLVFIDHGYDLPNPLIDEDFKGLKQTNFDFLTLTQVDIPIKGRLKDIILGLDIDRFIADIKEDQEQFLNFYTEYKKECSVPDDCYLLLKFNLLLLKKGVSMGKTIKDIALFQCYEMKKKDEYVGGEMIDCFKKVLRTDEQGRHFIDENILNDELEKIFPSDRIYTKEPWLNLNYSIEYNI